MLIPGFIATVTDRSGRDLHVTAVHDTREAACAAAFLARPSARECSTCGACDIGSGVRRNGMNIHWHRNHNRS